MVRFKLVDKDSTADPGLRFDKVVHNLKLDKVPASARVQKEFTLALGHGGFFAHDSVTILSFLRRCHALAVVLALLGFILTLVGILAFTWTSLPTSVATFASACVSACIAAILLVLNLPDSSKLRQFNFWSGS